MKHLNNIKIFRRLIYFIIGIVFISGNVFGQASMESLFKEGNDAYNEGAYQKAVSFYEQTLKMGQHSAALYYNLGNAYYRLNKVAESIYYFEKARRLQIFFLLKHLLKN